MNDADFLQELRTELLAAGVTVNRRRPHRRGALLGLAAALVLVIASIVVVAIPVDEAQASLRVTYADGRMIIELVDLTSAKDEIEADARRAGIDLTVKEVPVGPSAVGKFIAVNSDMPLTDLERVGVDPISGAFTAFRLPQDWTGSLEFEMGRAAREGEEWVAFSNALDRGEVLECRDLIGATQVQAAQEVAGDDIDVRWFAISPTSGAANVPAADLGNFASWRVTRALATGPDSVTLEITEDGRVPGNLPPGEATC